jgi:hypothetical protein
MAAEVKMMYVYTIVEKQGAEKPFWTKIGACFSNRDGSLNVLLDALPVNGRLHIRPREANHEEGERNSSFPADKTRKEKS